MAIARAKFWIPFLGVVGAIALGSQWLTTGDEPAEVAAPATRRAPAPGAPPAAAEPAFVLPQRGQSAAALEEQARDIFRTKSWYVPPPPPPPQPVVAPPPPPPPKAPPLPFQFLGWMDDGDQVRAFLSRGEKVYTVGAGEQIDASYRIDKVEATQITFTYLPLSETQTLPLTGNPGQGAAAAVPAVPAPVAGSGIGSAAAAAAAGVAGTLSPDQLDPAAVAMRIKQQQMRDRARHRAERR